MLILTSILLISEKNIYIGLVFTIIYLYILKNYTIDNIETFINNNLENEIEKMSEILNKNKDKGYSDVFIDNNLDYNKKMII